MCSSQYSNNQKYTLQYYSTVTVYWFPSNQTYGTHQPKAKCVLHVTCNFFLCAHASCLRFACARIYLMQIHASHIVGNPVSCCINNQSYGYWNKEQIKVAVTKQCTGTRSCMVIEIRLYGLDGRAWVCYLWLASAFNTVLWFYKHSVPNTLRTFTCTQSYHIWVYLRFFLECCVFYTHVPCVWHATRILNFGWCVP